MNITRMSVIILTVLSLQLSAIGDIHATEVVVGNADELIQAIRNDQSPGEDLIINLVEGTTYLLTEGYDKSDVNGTDNYTALPGIKNNVTINGNGAIIKRDVDDEIINYKNFRVFYVLSGKLALNNITFTAAEDQDGPNNGGVIYNVGTLEINNCNFTGNLGAGFGGVIYNNDVLTIADSTFTGNTASHGGAINNEINGTVYVSDLVFSDNDIGDYGNGGAIRNKGGEVIVEYSIFHDNYAGYGGAIGTYGSESDLVVKGCTFSGNRARASYGGAIDLSLSGLDVSQSAFEHNQADLDGGAIYMFSNSQGKPWSIESSTFYDNHAIGFFGGAISGLQSREGTIVNSTFVGNTAGSRGGAVSIGITSEDVTLENVIIAGNAAKYDSNIGDASLFILKGNNIVGLHDPDDFDFSNGSIITIDDNTELPSIFGEYLSDPEEPAFGYFPLVCSSENPAIDAGSCDPDYVDQLGNSAVGNCDLGSVELLDCEYVAGDTDGTDDGDGTGDADDSDGTGDGDGTDDADGSGAQSDVPDEDQSVDSGSPGGGCSLIGLDEARGYLSTAIVPIVILLFLVILYSEMRRRKLRNRKHNLKPGGVK